MRIGLFTPFSNPFTTKKTLAALGRAADERGFESIWAAEHVVLFDEYASRYPYAADGKIPAGGENGILDPFACLSFLASVTERVRLGTGICLVPQRNPVYTAKEAATVDYLSDGRLDFGVGVGWLREEFEALGVEWPQRGERCREYLEVVKRLWCDPVSEYKGAFYELPACRQYPKPVQTPHPPIHFGGESGAALRRVADLGQGWYGFNLEPEAAAERIRALERLLAERGRSREDVLMSVSPYLRSIDADMIKRYEDAGVDQVILLAFAPTEDRIVATLDSLAKLMR
ncbi:MAG: LLM class F420-dependent oxidoreductase [Myxococcota bacterium]